MKKRLWQSAIRNLCVLTIVFSGMTASTIRAEGLSEAEPAGQTPWEELSAIAEDACELENWSGRLDLSVDNGTAVRTEPVFLARAGSMKTAVLRDKSGAEYQVFAADDAGIYLNLGRLAGDLSERLSLADSMKEQIPSLLSMIGMETDWLCLPALLPDETVKSVAGLAGEICADLSPVLEEIPAEASPGFFRAKILLRDLGPAAKSLLSACSENADSWIESAALVYDGIDRSELVKPWAEIVFARLGTGEEEQKDFFERVENLDAQALTEAAGGKEELLSAVRESLVFPEDDPFLAFFGEDGSSLCLEAREYENGSISFTVSLSLSAGIVSRISEAAGQESEALPEIAGIDISSLLAPFTEKTDEPLTIGITLTLAPGETEIALPPESTPAEKVVGALTDFLKTIGVIGRDTGKEDSRTEKGSFLVGGATRTFKIEYDDQVFTIDNDLSGDFITYLNDTEDQDVRLAVTASEDSTFASFVSLDVIYYQTSGLFTNVQTGETEVTANGDGFPVYFCTLDCDSDTQHEKRLYYGLEAYDCFFGGVTDAGGADTEELMELVLKAFLSVEPFEQQAE